MATLDLSFLGIQGLVGCARHPPAYFNPAIHSLALGHDEYIDLAAKTGLLDRAMNAGLHVYSRTNFGEFMIGGVARHVPGVRQANLYFSRFGNVLRLELFRLGEKGAIAHATKLGK